MNCCRVASLWNYSHSGVHGVDAVVCHGCGGWGYSSVMLQIVVAAAGRVSDADNQVVTPMRATNERVVQVDGPVHRFSLWTNVELVSLPFQLISAHHCCDVTAHLSVVGLTATAAFDTCPTFWIYRPFWRIHRVTATRFCPISMPADFCRHLVGKNW